MAILSHYLAQARIARIAHYLQGDVLDLGCGDARILREYGSKIATYCGIERSKEQVAWLVKQYPAACFLQRNLDEDQLNLDRGFDCVLMIALIEHLFNQKHVMNQVAMSLKPNGVVVITTPTVFGNDVVHRLGAYLGLFDRSVANGHIVIYNRQRFMVLAREVGLVLKHYEAFQLFCNQVAILAKG